MKQVEAGRYEFFASHIGYMEQQYQAKGTEQDEGAMLSLTSGQTVDDAVFRLIRAGVITGKVVDDAGEPMMGVNVSVLHKPTEEERDEEGPRGKKLEMTMVSGGQTDDRGEFRVFNLKPGEYYVKAVETGESWAFGGVMEAGNDATVLRELGSRVCPGLLSGRNATRPGTGHHAERRRRSPARHSPCARSSWWKWQAESLVRTAGLGFARMCASRIAGVSDWGSELGASTDSGGEFSIKGVAAGSYFINASMRDKDKYYSTQQKIEVGEARIDSLVLVLGVGATIHGRMPHGERHAASFRTDDGPSAVRGGRERHGFRLYRGQQRRHV